VLEGYRHGKRAAWLVGADWENLLTEPVNSVRGRYGIVAPAYYQMVREAIAGASVLKHPPVDTAAVQ
jgi:ubiquinone biosynthesis protein COQ4